MEYPLTSRQQRFVELYALDRCGTQAAIGAGYTGRPAAAAVTASRLLRKPNVQAALQAQEARIAADLEVTRQRVLDGLLEAVEMARERADPAAMISAWREVGRLCGYYAPDRVQVGVQLGDAEAAELRRLEAMSDEELGALVNCPT
jgi:phage terminase small subunit